MRILPIISLLSVLIFSCDLGSRDTATAAVIDTVAIAEHISILSADDYLGRKPFTEGEVKTINYLKSQFESLGLEPGNGDSFFQEVPLVEITPEVSPYMQIDGGKKQVQLVHGKDFVAYSEQVTERISLDKSALVFAGYGVVAPEYNWNDYEGLDVRGKTVIVLVNDPGFESGDPDLFKGETMTYYGRWTYKYEEAARQGATGVLIVHETVPAGYPWLVVSNSWSGGKLNLDKSKSEDYQCKVQGWITRDAAIKIFESSAVDLKNYKEIAVKPDFQPLELGLRSSVTIENTIKKDNSFNVVARISGKVRPDETIIYSAHWDHLGVGNPIDGDSIYNGALDNASGTAMLLGIAKAFAQQEKPQRTVLFLAVTAEEQGLLGSKYYAENPIYDVKKTVANLNIDGAAGYGPMKDFTVIGMGQSELEDIAGKYVEGQGRYLYADPDPGKGYFFRSDHFSFAKVGIPALYASGDYEALNGGVERIENEKAEYLQNRYHKPADEFNDGWRYGGIYQDAEVYLKVGFELANSGRWPGWKEGSEFKAIREK